MAVLKYSFHCPSCNGTSEIERFSSNDVGPQFRCDKCSKLVFVSANGLINRTISPVTLEASLKNCDCGGVFKATAPARCSLCAAPISPVELESQIGPYFKNRPGLLGLVITAGQVPISKLLNDPDAF